MEYSRQNYEALYSSDYNGFTVPFDVFRAFISAFRLELYTRFDSLHRIEILAKLTSCRALDYSAFCSFALVMVMVMAMAMARKLIEIATLLKERMASNLISGIAVDTTLPSIKS